MSAKDLAEIGDVPRPAHRGTPWGVVLRSANLWTIMAMTACYIYTMYFFQSWFHTYLVKGRGYDESDLTLSALPFAVAAVANVCGGFASDALVRRLGLKWGRRTIGLVGLGSASLFLLAAMLTGQRIPALILLALTYGGICFQQPTVWAVCLDIGRKNAGAVTGAMNTAGSVGAVVSSVTFGYLVTGYGNYTAPLIPMAVLLFIGAALWLRIDATRELVAITATGRDAHPGA